MPAIGLEIPSGRYAAPDAPLRTTPQPVQYDWHVLYSNFLDRISDQKVLHGFTNQELENSKVWADAQDAHFTEMIWR